MNIALINWKHHYAASSNHFLNFVKSSSYSYIFIQ